MSSSAISVRSGVLSDAAELASVGRTAFTQTYGPYNTPTDIEAHLHNSYAIAVVEDKLQSPLLEYAIARVDGTAAGFGLLHLNSPNEAVGGQLSAEIKQLYVLEEFQRLRLGSKLLDHLREAAIRRDCDTLWLGVWERADWARRFYEKYGMVSVGTIEFMVGSDRQTDIVMALKL